MSACCPKSRPVSCAPPLTVTGAAVAVVVWRPSGVGVISHSVLPELYVRIRRPASDSAKSVSPKRADTGSPTAPGWRDTPGGLARSALNCWGGVAAIR